MLEFMLEFTLFFVTGLLIAVAIDLILLKYLNK